MGKNRVLEEKIDPIFGDLLSSAIPKARSRVKLLEPEFSDPAEPQTDAFKSWAWAQVMSLPKIHLVRVVNPDPLQMIVSAGLIDSDALDLLDLCDQSTFEFFCF